MLVTDKLKQEVLKKTEDVKEEGYHQTVLNIIYNHWQKDNINMSYDDIIEWIKEVYGEFAQLLVLLGKYNQQVCNGGHYQYYHNRYTGIEENETEAQIHLHKKLVTLLSKSELKDAISLQVLKLIDEFYIELDTEEYIEEEIFEDEGIIYDEYENSNYLEVVNTDMLSRFDTEYYAVNEEFMEIVEQHIKDKITEKIS